jgi:hypothetical protein
MLTSLGTLAGNFVAALIAVPFGLAFVGFAISLRIYLTTPLGLSLIGRVTGITLRDMLRSVAPQTEAGAIMMALLFLAKGLLLEDLEPIERLCIMVPMGALLYGAGMLLFGRRVLGAVIGEARPIVASVQGRTRRIAAG